MVNANFDNINTELTKFIDSTPTIFHCVENVSEILKENGFKKRIPGENKLSAGDKYFSVFSDSAVIAVWLPRNPKTAKLKVTAAHGDSPALKLKPNAEVETAGVISLSTERYGGLINSTWLDRPLKIAGRAVISDGNKVKSVNVKLSGDALIPNVAIHQNRGINSGFEYNPQTDLKALWSGKEKPLLNRIAEAANCKTDDICDFDLFLTCPQKGMIWGSDGEFISSPRLDDLQCVFTGLNGFLSSDESENIKIFVVFNNEEVGSRSVSGADSVLLYETAREIADNFGINLLNMAENGRLLSADNAHAIHPCHPELSEPDNHPVLNGGVVLKYNSNQNYITDALGGGEFKLMCKEKGIKYQIFANRSDSPGGSTLGSLSATQFPLKGVDIGVAQLSMHSSYETAGTADTIEIARAVKAFYEI